jgi:hypothetical protein
LALETRIPNARKRFSNQANLKAGKTTITGALTCGFTSFLDAVSQSLMENARHSFQEQASYREKGRSRNFEHREHTP